MGRVLRRPARCPTVGRFDSCAAPLGRIQPGLGEPVVVSVNHLDRARAGQYYEIWFQTGSHVVPGVAFNAGSNGTADIHLTAPINTKWVRCWITRQSVSDPSTSTIVMRATRTQTAT